MNESEKRERARRLRVRVSLWMTPGEATRFRDYEAQSFDVMARHNVRVIRISKPTEIGPDAPTEIHELEFPSKSGFAAYRADPRLAALADLRASAITRTLVEEVFDA